MLNNISVTPTLPVKDIQRSKEFYERKLGLSPSPEGNNEYVQHYRSANGEIEVYQSQYAGSNQATALTWNVGKNINQEVQNLRDKGILFEHYDFPESKLEGDIHVMPGMKAAWFKDPDGNILCLHGE